TCPASNRRRQTLQAFRAPVGGSGCRLDEDASAGRRMRAGPQLELRVHRRARIAVAKARQCCPELRERTATATFPTWPLSPPRRRLGMQGSESRPISAQIANRAPLAVPRPAAPPWVRVRVGWEARRV